MIELRAGDPIEFRFHPHKIYGHLEWQGNATDKIAAHEKSRDKNGVIFEITAPRVGTFEATLYEHYGKTRTALQRIQIVATPGKTENPEKVVWTFWHPAEKMPEFNKLLVRNWEKILGPTWTVRIVTLDPNSKNYYLNFISKDDLPKTFDSLNPTVMSDSVRISLLDHHGGVWMDSSIILNKNLDDTCWNQLADENSPFKMAGFFLVRKGSHQYQGKDYFENWFIAARRNLPFIKYWHKIFKTYWDDLSERCIHHPSSPLSGSRLI